MKKTFLLLLTMLTACTFPKDSEGSFEEAKDTSLKIGLVENPPYVITQGEEPEGSEVEMLREFASQEGLQVEFSKGSESDLVHKLEKFDLHIVAGGMDKKTLYKKKAALTTAYDQRHVFLIPKGENRLLEHLEKFIFSKKKQQ
ncbi:transporter substrate-binding domain-containing protein [Salinimicrobium sp. WS361]|uniref:transporter substrate-binding domain-containing protein n=1 Tax=Salinimicrobium sp. WS361 TaxID=3425123 RepID=UPI003D6F82A3